MKTYNKIYQNWTGRFVVTVNNEPVDPETVVVTIDGKNYRIDPENKTLVEEDSIQEPEQIEAPSSSRVVPYPNKSYESRLKSILSDVSNYHKTRNRGKAATREYIMFNLVKYFAHKGIDLFRELEKARSWYSEMNWAVRTRWIRKADIPDYLRPAQVRDLTLIQIIATRPEWRALAEDYLSGCYRVTCLV